MPSATKVDAIFRDCLFKDEEIIDGKPIVEPVCVRGIINHYGFHPERLKNHHDEIVSELSTLPDTFKKSTESSGGGGWSFLNACMDTNGNQWGEHINIEQLVCLGMGIDKVEWCLSREYWSVFPCGMPYFVIKD